MKVKHLFLWATFMLLAFNCNVLGQGQCKAKQIANACKDNIRKPFKYDSYAINEFTFDDKEKQVEVQFTAFQGQKYKIVFCSSGFDEPLSMNVYDKSMKIHNNRHKLYDNSKGIDSNFWTFEPTKSGNYYILYEVPKSIDGAVKKGCVVMLIGYVDDEEE
jgi:hypothetical protein